MTRLSRRQFVIGGTTGLAATLAARTAPAVGQTREISYLCWNNFAPNSDKKLAEIGQRFTKDTGIKLKIDHISHMGPQQAKHASEAPTQAGPHPVGTRKPVPRLHEPPLVDLREAGQDVDQKQGKA